MDVRNRLALALDVPDLDRAEQLIKEVAPWFGIAKVGLELFSAAGPEAVARMRALDLEVFADIKLHDIPTTVGRAARVLGRQGVRYLNFHAAGGVDMLRAGVEGLAQGARDGGHTRAIPIAVTVLTSDPDAHAFDQRVRWSRVFGRGSRARPRGASGFRDDCSRCAICRRRATRSSAHRHTGTDRARRWQRACGRSRGHRGRRSACRGGTNFRRRCRGPFDDVARERRARKPFASCDGAQCRYAASLRAQRRRAADAGVP